ncbi:MAG TPA: hypothetical protein VJ276_16200 [Thermoanaerobaculia bacterium]|nr:hypothetical protein [Thermoanaerobaculia bacterium]
MSPLTFTAVYVTFPDREGVTGYVEELLGVQAEGKTIEEAAEKLKAAAQLEIATCRFESRRRSEGFRIAKRAPLIVTIPDSLWWRR